MIGDKIDYVFISISTFYSLNNLEHTLGVILLCLQIVWLVVKFAIKIYQYFTGKITSAEVEESAEQFIIEFEDAIETNKERSSKNGESTDESE